jgi:tricorn protease
VKKIFILLLFICFIFAGLPAENLKLMRTPDASIDKICFIYENDLFTADLNGNNLKRIVKAAGIESNPKFSPDGKWIGFSSTFNGETAMFI